MTNKKQKKLVKKAQTAEITEHLIYSRLSRLTKNKHNREIMKKISQDELRHYRFWVDQTGREEKPSRFKIFLYILISRLLGFTFGLRLMERGEDIAQTQYQKLSQNIPEVKEIINEELEHEQKLLDLLDEERLQYVGSVVLGLNDALVELTGAISGFTLALQDTKLIAMVSLITGISASLSMAGSEYLSTKTEENETKHPVKASLYTGVAYAGATFVLVLPFFLLLNPFLSLVWALVHAVLIISGFTFYISVAKNYSFRKRFLEMLAISMGVAALSFLIGLVVRQVAGIE
jgi:VIT1/CCC1 family predicted Fe2+/Mn2+ transporter